VPAGAVAALALPAFAGLTRRDLPGLAALDAPGPGGSFSRLFRLLLFAIRLRRPDMFGAMEATPAAALDWAIVFGLAEHRLWHLLPVADRKRLLAGTATEAPVFLRAALRFREDLRALTDRPLVLRDWLRCSASGEYGITLEEPPQPPPRRGRLTVIGPWKQVLGIADDCFSACRALDALGCDYEVLGTRPAAWIETDRDKWRHLRARAVEVPRGERALFCDTLFEATRWALAHFPRFARFRRADLFAPWELPGLPAGWRAAAGLFETVMAPSAFARDAFAGSPAGRVLRVTSSVEVIGRPRPASALLLRRHLTLPRGQRFFACVFDFSSYLARKNPEAVLAAFARLRRQVPNLVLVVKTTRGRRSRGDARRLRARLRGIPGVVWVDGPWPNAAVEALLQHAAAFVSLHRAEGFGRNIAKTLLLGGRAVVTDWSGSADLRPEPGYFGVACRLIGLTDADYVLGEGQVWAEPDPRDAVRRMRSALAPGPRPAPSRGGLRLSRQRLARRLGRALFAAPR
jgi:glycosyltransferase involved in cell wall biosynthesis